MWAQCWTVSIDRPLTKDEYRTLLALLPPARRVRLMGQPTEKHGEILCAYGLLLALLRARYGWRTLPAMETEAAGKPCFPAYPGVCFSLSHTTGGAAAAVSDRPVGVDIQCSRPVSARLLKQLNAETPEVFSARWTALETRAKRAGGGLLPLLRAQTPPEPGEYCTVSVPFPGCAAALASSVPEPVVRHLELEALFQALS